MLWRGTSLLALSLSGAFGQTPGVSSGVGQLIQQAFQRNREILAAQQRVAEARGLMRQAGVRPAPTVEVNAGTGRPLGTHGEEEYSLGYFQPIETGGKRSRRMLVAEKGLELAEAELAERSRQLAYDIKTRYIDAAANRRKVEAVDRIVRVNREAYRLVDARVQRDDAAPLERQLLLVELNRTEAQRTGAVGQAQAAEFDLRRTAALGPDAPLVSFVWDPRPQVSASLDDLRRRALEIRPDLRAARALASQTAAEVELAEALSMPDLTLSAQYTRRTGQFEDPIRTTGSGPPLVLQDRDNVLTFGISIPLQSRKRNLGNIEAASTRQSAAELRREHLEITIPLEVEAAWQRYRAARSTVEILNRGVVEESQRNLSIIRQAYTLGQLRLLDVLNEQRRLLETELSYIDAEAELARSRAELELATGGDLR
ncbi:MAG: TolC family protein [Bryobacterales bacterium]|nr:TolC family protein [Bryobacterales bacterium]